MSFEGSRRYHQSRTRKGAAATYFYDLGSPMSFGATPSSDEVVDGHMHFDGEQWYLYDETRAKWLSLAETQAGFGKDGAVAVSTFLDYVGCGLSANRFGHVCRRDCTLVGYTWDSGLATTATLRVKATGVQVTTIGLVAMTEQTDNAVDVDLSAGDVISVDVGAGSIPNKHRLNLYLRHRI